jgi:hypothetical protein
MGDISPGAREMVVGFARPDVHQIGGSQYLSAWRVDLVCRSGNPGTTGWPEYIYSAILA